MLLDRMTGSDLCIDGAVLASSIAASLMSKAILVKSLPPPYDGTISCRDSWWVDCATTAGGVLFDWPDHIATGSAVRELKTCDTHRVNLAALFGASATLDSLVACGEAMSDKDRDGRTVTQYAAWGGSIECVKHCVANGGGAMAGEMSDKDRFGRTVTHYAARGGSIECVKHCVANGGVAMSDKDNSGTTVTQYAAVGGSIECVKHCVANGGGPAPT